MSRKRAHALCATHGCHLISPVMPPYCPKCRASKGGSKRSPAQVAATTKNLAHGPKKRWQNVTRGLEARQRLGEDT